jgi:drug/metabolite transporter (DMT)-like permease
MFPAFLTTVLFSISGVAANRTTRILGGTEANFWRILLAALLLGILANVYGFGLSGPALKIFFLSGIIGFGIGDLALYQAYPRLGSRLSIMLVHCLAAPFGAVVEWLWLGNRISVSEAGCGLLILAGVALALAPGEHLHIPRRSLAIGSAMGVLAAFGQGFGAVLSRRAYGVCDLQHFRMDGISGGITAAYQRIWGGLLVAFLSMLWVKLRRREPRARYDWSKITPWLLSNVAAGPALGVACYQWALDVERTAIVLPIVALTPLVVIPFSWHIEGERPSLRSILGGVIAVVGVIGLTFARLK